LTREFEAYIRLLEIRAEDLVATPLWWTMIDAVAKGLIERKRMSVHEAKLLIRDALGWPTPKPLITVPQMVIVATAQSDPLT
jgi:hypothetical protein